LFPTTRPRSWIDSAERSGIALRLAHENVLARIDSIGQQKLVVWSCASDHTTWSAARSSSG